MLGLDLGFAGDDLASSAPPAYAFTHAEAAAYVARMSMQPDDARKALIDTLFGALKTGATSGTNILGKLDALYLGAAHDAQAGLLNIVSAGIDLAVEGTPSFRVDRGYANTKVGDALSLGVGASGLTKFITNSACFGVWVRSALINQSTNTLTNGLAAGAIIQLTPRNSSGIIAARINGASAVAGSTVATGYGLTAVNRSASNAVQIYKDGAAAGTGTAASSTRTADTLKLAAEQQYACAFFGQSLTADEHMDLRNALLPYMVAVGVTELVPATPTWASEATGLFPDGDAPYVAGKGLNSLGWTRDPVDGSWWIARGIGGGSMTQAGVAHMAADPVTGEPTSLLSDWTLTEINATDSGGTITDLAAGSCQGITIDTTDQTIYVINKVASQLFRIDKSGQLLNVYSINATANGLAYDAIRDKLIIYSTGGNVVWCNKDGTSATGSSAKTIQLTAAASGDQLFHDAATDWLYMSRDSSTSTDSHCWVYKLSEPHYPLPHLAIDATLTSARAIEGVVFWNGKLWSTSDPAFHTGQSGSGVITSNHWRRNTP